MKSHIKIKLNKVFKIGYVQSGFGKILIRLFTVPKPISDIHMIYDGTDSGFNKYVWVPNHGLPTVKILLRGTGNYS